MVTGDGLKRDAEAMVGFNELNFYPFELNTTDCVFGFTGFILLFGVTGDMLFEAKMCFPVESCHVG